jgi:hypothetical protein
VERKLEGLSSMRVCVYVCMDMVGGMQVENYRNEGWPIEEGTGMIKIYDTGICGLRGVVRLSP